MAEPDALPRCRSNLQGRVDGASIYAALAESERNRAGQPLDDAHLSFM